MIPDVFCFSCSVLWILFVQWTFSISAARQRETLYVCVLCEDRGGWCSQKEFALASLLLLCECQRPNRSLLRIQHPWVTASFLLWSPWEQESVFPSKLSGAVHHIKRRCHESAWSSTGNPTIAELTAYKAVRRGFNGLWFPTWPSWLRYLKSVKWLMFVFCLNSEPTCICSMHTRASNSCKSAVHNRLFVTFTVVQQFNSSAGNSRITETEAVQLENINCTHDGGTLPYTPQWCHLLQRFRLTHSLTPVTRGSTGKEDTYSGILRVETIAKMHRHTHTNTHRQIEC